MTLLKNLLLCVAVVTLTACAGTYHSYYQTLQLAFAEKADVNLSLAEVTDLSVDLMLLRRGDRPAAALALAYIEAGQHKWVSADKALLIIEQGRIVRTSGFAQDLLFLSNTSADPIKQTYSGLSGLNWLRGADWSQNEYGYQLYSDFETHGRQMLMVFGQQIDTVLIVENVAYHNPSNYFQAEQNWQNYFWYEPISGTLLKTKQRLSPYDEALEITYLSQIARLMPIVN
jgi:hypothetical protein